MSESSRGSVLLLEDDWDHRNVFRHYLEHRGWVVREATEAGPARALVASEHPDAVVLDLGGTNGWTLLEELGTSVARPRLICVTGDARPESRDRAARLGADDYLLKPIPLRRLAEAVERLVDPTGASPSRPSASAPASTAVPTPPVQAPRRNRTGGPRPAAGEPVRAAETAERARPVVLLLEDDDDARVIYRDMLDFAGYEVIAASDGVEGLRYAETCPPDVVVTDLHMPGMNGLDVARTLRQESGGLAPAIIAVTADSLGLGAARVTDSDRPLFDEVLVKPVSPGELVRAVRSYAPPVNESEGS